jgi:hypothetical protein
LGKVSQVEGPASLPRSKETEAGKISSLESFKRNQGAKSHARGVKKIKKHCLAVSRRHRL